MTIAEISDSIQNNKKLEINFNDLSNIKLSTSNPWFDILRLHSYIQKYKNDEFNDKNIIKYLLTTIQHLSINDNSRNHCLEVFKILFNLLYKYGLFRSAQSQLLNLKSLLSEPYPTWIQNYSAKALFKIDIDSVFLNADVFFQMVLDGHRKNEKLDSQTIAVVNDLLNSFPETISESLLNDFRNIKSFISTVNSYIDPFGNIFSETWNNSISRTIESLSPKLNANSNDIIEVYKLKVYHSELLIEKKDIEIGNLQTELSAVRESCKKLTAEIDEQEKSFSSQIDSIRKTEIGMETNVQLNEIKILVLGASQISDKIIFGLAKNLDISKNQLELITDYSDSKRFDIDKIKFNSSYDGILVGPIAHNIIGSGDYGSAIMKLKTEEGFPPVQEIRNKSGQLKISKTSFKDSLKKLLDTITSNISV